MRLVKRPKPLGVCNVCGQLTNMLEMVNHRCNRIVHGRRCAGQFKSELGYVWVSCESCEGAGKVGSQKCRECLGYGWRLLGA